MGRGEKCKSLGVALLTAAVLFIMSNLTCSAGGTALILRDWKLWAGAREVDSGALMTLGSGPPLYILIILLAWIRSSVPIMMGLVRVLMPVASARFIRMESFSPGGFRLGAR